VVTFTAKNTGNSISAPFYAALLWSTDQTVDGGDAVLVDSVQIDSLDAGQDTTLSVTCTVPNNAVVQRYYILVQADRHTDVFESDEGDNSFAVAEDVVRPNLSVQYFGALEGAILAGDTMSFQFIVRNSIANVPAAPSWIAFYWSVDDNLSADDAALGAFHIPDSIKSTRAYNGQCTRATPAGAVPGWYYIFAVADSGNLVQETNENDNVGLSYSIEVVEQLAPGEGEAVHQNILQLPSEVTLVSTYPNPFNPVAKVTYGLPQAAPVKLTVHDMSGRLVATLVDRTQSAGWYTAEWSGNNSPTGIYIFTLVSDGKTLVQKGVLMK
jgi:hypothetical protein